MRTLLIIPLFLMSLMSFPSWGNELDGKILNCKCKSESQNCIDDYNATGNEQEQAFRKHDFFRIFSIVFKEGSALKFYPVENDTSDGIFITGSIDDPPAYFTTLDEIIIKYGEPQENMRRLTKINRETLIYTDEIQLKYNTGFEVWFSSEATCGLGDSMLVFEIKNVLQEQYQEIKRKNKL